MFQYSDVGNRDYFVSFLVCYHLEEEERVGCLGFIILRVYCLTGLLSYGCLVAVNVL